MTVKVTLFAVGGTAMCWIIFAASTAVIDAQLVIAGSIDSIGFVRAGRRLWTSWNGTPIGTTADAFVISTYRRDASQPMDTGLRLDTPDGVPVAEFAVNPSVVAFSGTLSPDRRKLAFDGWIGTSAKRGVRILSL